MPLSVGTVLEVVPSWLDGPELAESVLHYKVKTASSNDVEQDITNIAGAIAALCEALTESCMCTTTLFVGSSGRVIPPSTGAGRIFTAFRTVVGTVSGEVCGAQIAALCSKYTTGITRSHRGRLYVPFVPESSVESGRITDAARTVYLSKLYPLLLNDVSFAGGGVLDPVLYSKTLAAAFEITEAVLRPVVCTQRRRVVHKQPFGLPA